MTDNLTPAIRKFNRLLDAWEEADRECTRAYVKWQEACRVREQAAIEKNRAGEDVVAIAKFGAAPLRS